MSLGRLSTQWGLTPLARFAETDSTVLAYVLAKLNKQHDYGLQLYLLSIDEGITGYRDMSLEVSNAANLASQYRPADPLCGPFLARVQTVKRNEVDYGLQLKILSYEDLYGGWTMDRVVAKIGKKNNCESRHRPSDSGIVVTELSSIAGTYCGVFRRQALDVGSEQLGANHLVTGHCADDIA